jgi:hypothetical protein
MKKYYETASRPSFLCRAGTQSRWSDRQFECQINDLSNRSQSPAQVQEAWKCF